MTEITPEALDKAIKSYSEEIQNAHRGLRSDEYYTSRASAMKRILYDLNLIDDFTNHEIVSLALGVKPKKVKR